MEYTFETDNGTEKTVNIPDEYIVKNTKNLDISVKECIYMWLCDNGYMSDPDQEELNGKAQGSMVRASAQKKRKAPTRKPDETKRELISTFELVLKSIGKVNNVNVENVERLISFTIGDDTYNLTLSKKRKAK